MPCSVTFNELLYFFVELFLKRSVGVNRDGVFVTLGRDKRSVVSSLSCASDS